MMKRLLLLLASCFRLGLSCDTVRYGNGCMLMVSRRGQSIVFSPRYSSDEQILWRRDDLSPQKNSKGKLEGSFFKLYNLTQKDSGLYKVLDKDQNLLSSKDIKVAEHRKFIETFDGESIEFTFNLEPSSCNINYIQFGDAPMAVVVHGRLHEDSPASSCRGFKLSKPCGLLNNNIQESCSGNFWVTDADDNLALAVSLTVQALPPQLDDTNYGTIFNLAFGLFFIALGIVTGCCSCLVHFNKKSSNTPVFGSPNAEPVARYQEYEREPAGGRQQQRSMPASVPTSMPARVPTTVPAYTPATVLAFTPTSAPTCVPASEPASEPTCAPTEPLIHNPQTTSEPAVYPKVSPQADQADVPLAPAHSEPGHRFEPKGLTFPPAFPLSSDSPCSDVYSSDKLNFR